MKQYYLKGLILFCILTCLISFPYTKASLPLVGKIIVLDAGHGGKDPGTMYKDVLEKDINLKIVLALENELQKKGATVILTRDKDYDLSSPKATRRKKSDFDNRIKIINSSGANMYLSIHLNYLIQEEYYGPQVFYNDKSTENKKIASLLQNALNKKLGSKREVKKIPSTTYMYSRLNVPGVLIECGFLSNAKERRLLQDSKYQKKLARYIANAVVKAF